MFRFHYPDFRFRETLRVPVFTTFGLFYSLPPPDMGADKGKVLFLSREVRLGLLSKKVEGLF